MVLRAIVGVGLCTQLSFASHRKGGSGQESLQTCDAALTEEGSLGRASLRIGDTALTEEGHRVATRLCFAASGDDANLAATFGFLAKKMDMILQNLAEDVVVDLRCAASDGPAAIFIMQLLKNKDLGIPESGLATKVQAHTIASAMHFLAQSLDLSSNEISETLRGLLDLPRGQEHWGKAGVTSNGLQFEHPLILARSMPKTWLALQPQEFIRDHCGSLDTSCQHFSSEALQKMDDTVKLKLVTDLPEIGKNATDIEKQQLDHIIEDISTGVKETTESFIASLPGGAAKHFNALKLEAPSDGVIATTFVAPCTPDAERPGTIASCGVSRVVAVMSRGTALMILHSEAYRQNPYVIFVVDHVVDMLRLCSIQPGRSTTTVGSLSEIGVVAVFDPSAKVQGTDVESLALTEVSAGELEEGPLYAILGGTVDPVLSLSMLEHFQDGRAEFETSASMQETSQGGKSLAEVSPLKTLAVVVGMSMLHGSSGFAGEGIRGAARERIRGASSVALNAGPTDDGEVPQEPDPRQILETLWRQRLGMSKYLATISKLFSIPGGLHMLGSAWTAGKVAESRGGPNVYQSEQLRLGLMYFFRVNGILPRVHFRPIDETTRKALVDIYGDKGKTLSAEDIKLAPFYVSNHVSYLDGPLLFEVLRSLKVIAKAELENIPLLGKIFERAGVIYVDREDDGSRVRTLLKLKRHLQDWKVGEDRPLLIFPEGTTENGQQLEPFNPGVFGARAKVLDSDGNPVRDAEGKVATRLGPVRIVLLVYDEDRLSKTLFLKTPQGIEDFTDPKWAAMFLEQLRTEVHIEVLPPRFPSDAEDKDPRLYMKNVQDEMQAALSLLRKEKGLPYVS